MKGVQTDPIEEKVEKESISKKSETAEDRFNRMMGDEYT